LRNAEVIRQWKILKRIEAGRWTSGQDLAEEHGVTERTIRRDLEALQEAGFPLYDERMDGRKVWRLIEGYKQRLTQSFSLAELSALYFGKNMMSFLGGAPFASARPCPRAACPTWSASRTSSWPAPTPPRTTPASWT
jgi:predicted DNA-binding transcriptional regulator YafY